VSYLTRFLENLGFMGKPTDKTDKTPITVPESEVSSVLSVPSPSDTKKPAPVPSSDPEYELPQSAPDMDSLDLGAPPSVIRLDSIPVPGVWRDNLASWAIPWRQKWADRAERYQAAGALWIVAEWRAFCETADEFEAAKAAGEVIEHQPPAPSDDAAAIEASLGWALDARWSWSELVESGRRHNAAVVSRPAAREPAPEPPISNTESQQLTMFK
jgi:hypothetical protein